MIFSLLVSPEADLYHHPAMVETDLQDVGVYGMCIEIALCADSLLMCSFL